METTMLSRGPANYRAPFQIYQDLTANALLKTVHKPKRARGYVDVVRLCRYSRLGWEFLGLLTSCGSFSFSERENLDSEHEKVGPEVIRLCFRLFQRRAVAADVWTGWGIVCLEPLRRKRSLEVNLCPLWVTTGTMEALHQQPPSAILSQLCCFAIPAGCLLSLPVAFEAFLLLERNGQS